MDFPGQHNVAFGVPKGSNEKSFSLWDPYLEDQGESTAATANALGSSGAQGVKAGIKNTTPITMKAK